MLKGPATTLAAIFLLLLVTRYIASPQSTFESTHSTDKIAHFGSVQEITNHFAKAQVPIKVLDLKVFRDKCFAFAAYPYSGLDTIDIYCFVKYGEQWVIQMLYFHRRPKQRELRVEENPTQIVIFCGQEEVLRLSPDPTLNSLSR